MLYLENLTAGFFAINERYDPATKKVEHEFKKFKLIPANFAQRYDKILEGPFDRAGKQRIVKELMRLVEEATQLIK